MNGAVLRSRGKARFEYAKQANCLSKNPLPFSIPENCFTSSGLSPEVGANRLSCIRRKHFEYFLAARTFWGKTAETWQCTSSSSLFYRDGTAIVVPLVTGKPTGSSSPRCPPVAIFDVEPLWRRFLERCTYKKIKRTHKCVEERRNDVSVKL